MQNLKKAAASANTTVKEMFAKLGENIESDGLVINSVPFEPFPEFTEGWKPWCVRLAASEDTHNLIKDDFFELQLPEGRENAAFVTTDMKLAIMLLQHPEAFENLLVSLLEKAHDTADEEIDPTGLSLLVVKVVEMAVGLVVGYSKSLMRLYQLEVPDAVHGDD